MSALFDPIRLHDRLDDRIQAPAGPTARGALLDPGLDLTLRPMRYPEFYDRYRDAIRNTWTVEEVDFSDDLVDLSRRLLPAERHLVSRLVAFFATGDSIVANNLVLNLYRHVADQRLVRLGLPKRYGSPIPSPSWSCRTSRSWRTSSSAPSPPTRPASPARWPSTGTSDRTGGVSLPSDLPAVRSKVELATRVATASSQEHA